jgi:hypothetical protein
MRIDDYEPGTAFIRLYKSHFKYEEDFEAILKFLKQSEQYTFIDLPVYENDVEGSLVDLPGQKRGSWTNYSSTMMECSICKKHVPYHRYSYCPHCGAKMEKINERK